MSIPTPVVGLVINYSYLWRHEHDRGFLEGSKDRPCAVILTIEKESGLEVAVLGITHTPPLKADQALEIPQVAKRRLGLDAERSWIVTTETNVFLWPGPDLRPRNADDQESIAFGMLPADVMLELRRRFRERAVSRQIRLVRRTPA